MKNNPILDANLSHIEKYNPKLKYKILKIKELTKDISFTNTVLNEPNLSYNSIPLHSHYGAESQAKEIYEKVTNNNLTLHVLYGFGLGYLFQEFAQKSKGIVFVYEPDIEILAVTLEVVDFSKELAKKNVFIFNDFEELKRCYLENYIYKSDTLITFLPSYKELFNEDFTDFINKINFVMGSAIIDSNYITNKLIPAVKSVCNNIDCLINETPLANYQNIYEGKTALIISAGPSLDKNIETIKKYRENAIIFTVGQAARTLITNEIQPDFIGLVETTSQMVQIEGLDTSNINLILEPLTFNGLHKSNFKNKLSYPSKNSTPNQIWSSLANIDSSPYISSGTVSYMLLYSAMILGFKNIILVGPDLAFLYGKCYTKNSQHNGLIYEIDETTQKAIVKIENLDSLINSLFSKASPHNYEQKIEIAKKRVENINKNLCTVAGIKGNSLITTLDYASFIMQFNNFAKKFNELNLYNTSLEGAKIDGFKDIPLDEILKDKEKIEKIEITPKNNFNKNEIIANIKFEINMLDEILKLLSNTPTLIAGYDKEFHHRNSTTETCIQYFKQLMLLYLDLRETYCPKSKIFNLIQKPYQQEINYCLKII